MIWAINDSSLRPGVYYNNSINELCIVSDSTWYYLEVKTYPLSGWIRIGEL